jgi:hypothetical protein
MPGVPNRPDLVTVVPFYLKTNETDDEEKNVAIPAEVDGRRGIFLLDLGSTWFELNRTYLQPSPTGGVDTVTDANRIPEKDTSASVGAHVTVRIGTMVDQFEDTMQRAPDGRPVNAVLNHMWNNFSTGGFVPRLGHIGPTVLEPFETIIDYAHQRVILIRLDKAGHRLVPVPAYTPKWSAPLIDIPTGPGYLEGHHYFWGVQVLLGGMGGVPESFRFDTGMPDNHLRQKSHDELAGHLSHEFLGTFGILDSLVIAGRAFTSIPVGFAKDDEDRDWPILGSPFLRSLGIIGFNHRTHQFILYR